MAYNDFVKET